MPAIFLFSNSEKMHITSQVGWGGNHAYNDGKLEENEWVKVVIKQENVKEVCKYAAHPVITPRRSLTT